MAYINLMNVQFCVKKLLKIKMKALIDKLEAYTYNKSTVWFLSTPIQ